jgi:acid phosphatase (class A)
MEGKILGSAAVARMHAEPAFLADIAAARKEWTEARAQGKPPTRNCAAEAAALKP